MIRDNIIEIIGIVVVFMIIAFIVLEIRKPNNLHNLLPCQPSKTVCTVADIGGCSHNGFCGTACEEGGYATEVYQAVKGMRVCR